MTLPKSLTTVTTFSKLIALLMFVTFPFIGFYLGMVYEQKVTPIIQEVAVNQPANLSPTPTPDPTANWKTYTNAKIGFQVKYPALWVERDVVSSNDSNLVYLNSNESFGSGVEPLQYYVWISAEDKLPNVSLIKEKIGNYNAYKTSELPSRLGSLSVFITKDGKKFISISITPYDLKQPFESQSRYIDIFNLMLSTFKFTN